MFIITKVSLDEISTLRIDYLKSLPVFQDYYLELLIEDADCFVILQNDSILGYVLISSDKILLEYYLIDPFLINHYECFQQVIRQCQVTGIYCKTFDAILLDCCLTAGYAYSVLGRLFRHFRERNQALLADLHFRYADDSDLEFLMQQEDEVFEPKDKISEYIFKKEILIAYDLSNHIVGCGFFIQTHPSFDFYDLGVWVSPQYRRKGYASQIMQYLIGRCLKNNLIPVCGCDANNKASYTMLQKSGFISMHKVIAFEVT